MRSKALDIESAQKIVSLTDDDLTKNRISIYYSGNEIYSDKRVNNSAQGSISTSLIPDFSVLEYHDIVVVYKESYHALYVDGIFVAEDIVSLDFGAPLIYFGFTAGAYGYNFFADVKEVKVFNSIAEAKKQLTYIT